MAVETVLVTLNCAKRVQNPELVRKLIKEATRRTKCRPGVVACAFQEVAPIMDGALGNTGPFLKPIRQGIEGALDDIDSGEYYCVGSSCVGAIVCLVYAHRTIRLVGDVLEATAAVGYFRSSLKGGAGIRVT
jgi:hypothetical protein